MVSRIFLTSLLTLASAQSIGKLPEVHPKLQTWKCTKARGCKSQTSQIVLDALSHPLYQVNAPTLNCGDWGNGPNKTVCPDAATCAQNCIVEGIADYTKYGVKTEGANLHLNQLMDGKSVSPRVYLLDEAGENYEMLKLTGGELTFDVDSSKLPCGMNGALYLSEMEADGGKSKSSVATTGARYGSGYCDAQCYVYPFVNGEANLKAQGACCNEMDIWEANARATSIAPHVCNQTSLYRCTGPECEFNGVCDKWGCSYNPYGLGQHSYYGPSKQYTVDTSRPFTVVTQFPADANGKMTSIRRLYVQDGKIIKNAAVNITGTKAFDELNTEFCSRPGGGTFIPLGGIEGMGSALSRGMVLIFSVWWDVGGFMQWMDGGNAGPCNTTEGDPKNIVKIQPDPAVTFSGIRWGEIDSTYRARSME
ncbi:endoglucanase-like protein [Tricladium varicosporioides]|nr:endoglucanase-like protein [Hymenoscyphus varicosporioides]